MNKLFHEGGYKKSEILHLFAQREREGRERERKERYKRKKEMAGGELAAPPHYFPTYGMGLWEFVFGVNLEKLARLPFSVRTVSDYPYGQTEA